MSIPVENTAEVRRRFEQALSSDKPFFIIIFSEEANLITDLYQDVCDYCVLHLTHHASQHAIANGFLAEKGVAMLNGHNHEKYQTRKNRGYGPEI